MRVNTTSGGEKCLVNNSWRPGTCLPGSLGRPRHKLSRLTGSSQWMECITSLTTCSGFCTDNWSRFCRKKHSVCRATSRKRCMHWSTPAHSAHGNQITRGTHSERLLVHCASPLTCSDLLLVGSVHIVLAHQGRKTRLGGNGLKIILIL